MKNHSILTSTLSCTLLVANACQADAADDRSLPVAQVLITDASLPKKKVDSQILAARRFYAFWNSGDTAYLDAAIDPTFTDRTLPSGRPQGPTGPAFASKDFRAAVPDLRCDVEQMVVAGDRVVAHLRFHGHFTGKFGQTSGAGQAVDFIATDILRVQNGRITDNWHIEDNLTLFRQLGLVSH